MDSLAGKNGKRTCAPFDLNQIRSLHVTKYRIGVLGEQSVVADSVVRDAAVIPEPRPLKCAKIVRRPHAGCFPRCDGLIAEAVPTDIGRCALHQVLIASAGDMPPLWIFETNSSKSVSRPPTTLTASITSASFPWNPVSSQPT